MRQHAPIDDLRSSLPTSPHSGAGSTDSDSAWFLVAAADVLSRLALDHRWTAAQVQDVLDTAAEASGVPGEATATLVLRDALRDPRLLEYPPRLATAALLRLLQAGAGVDEVAFWRVSTGGHVTCDTYLGEHRPTKRMREVAAAAVRGDADVSPRALIRGVAVSRWHEPWGALVVRSRSGGIGRAASLVDEAAAVLSVILERDHFLLRNEQHERAVVASSERRLVRLGFDLHDGPLQELVLLAHELRELRNDVAPGPAVTDDPVAGRLDRVDAGLRDLDEQLRDLAVSLKPASLDLRPFQEALEHDVASFADRTGIDATAVTAGDFDVITPSQRIALLLVVKEALGNAAKHGGAKHARVTVTVHVDRIAGAIWDDGCGFDVDRALARAANVGRLGLLGMRERLRLLGGHLAIWSRPGDPTEVRFSLPVWLPLEGVHGRRRRTDHPAL